MAGSLDDLGTYRCAIVPFFCWIHTAELLDCRVLLDVLLDGRAVGFTALCCWIVALLNGPRVSEVVPL